MRRASALLAVAFVSLLACGSGVRVQAQAVPSAVAAAAGEFGYTGDDGPAFWAQSAHAPACAATNERQSPIDLSNATEDRQLEPLELDLRTTSYVLSNPGYTVVSTPETQTQTFILGGVPFKLLQFHFHTLSEHTVDGRQGVMELHAVFQNVNHSYQLAVVGLIYKMGDSNPFLEKLLAKGLPQKSTSPNKVVRSIDLAEAFPDTTRYFTYFGSLTTPPCDETVQWFVLKDWAEMSPQQFQTIHDVLGNDFRPLQRRYGRTIRETPR